jgi:AcrR family transcriptional regulator
MKSADTKTRILDAAELLFAEHGIDAASLRDIAAQAQVNLAAANYHFGGKERLVQAVVARRFAPITQRRLALLDAAEANGRNAVEPVLDAFIRPIVEGYSPLMVRLLLEHPDRAQVLFLEQARETINRFDKAFARVCPHLDFVERHWCMHFFAGSAMMSLSGARLLAAHSRGKCSVKDTNALIRRLIAHHAPGFKKKGAR